MNRMTINDTEYSVLFKRTRTRTFCQIYAGPADSRDKDKALVAEAFVQRWSNDPDNRVIARTYALGKATEQLPSVGNVIFEQTSIRKKFFADDPRSATASAPN